MKLLLTNCEKCPNAIDKTQKTVIMTYGAKKQKGTIWANALLVWKYNDRNNKTGAGKFV